MSRERAGWWGMHGYNAGVAVANDTLLMVYSVQSADVAQGGQNDVYGAYFRVSRNSSAKTDDSIVAPDGPNRTRRHLIFAASQVPKLMRKDGHLVILRAKLFRQV